MPPPGRNAKGWRNITGWNVSRWAVGGWKGGREEGRKGAEPRPKFVDLTGVFQLFDAGLKLPVMSNTLNTWRTPAEICLLFRF